jgi:hypothetical protein
MLVPRRFSITAPDAAFEQVSVAAFPKVVNLGLQRSLLSFR